MEEFTLTMQNITGNDLFLALVPFVASLLTQLVKQKKIPGELILAAVSVAMGISNFFLSGSQVEGVGIFEQIVVSSGYIWTMATGYYKTLLKIFPALSSKNGEN